jgi:hypothetical protein
LLEKRLTISTQFGSGGVQMNTTEKGKPRDIFAKVVGLSPITFHRANLLGLTRSRITQIVKNVKSDIEANPPVPRLYSRVSYGFNSYVIGIS